MITIHHLGVSQSDRVVWLMEELQLPYELKWYDRGEDFLAPPEYRALHPSGTAPIITDGELVMAESTAIVEYISQRYGEGKLSVPVDSPEYPHYLYWMQFNNNLQTPIF
ncbi:MAG: glutathione S-transferase N-terminal domain-containing protein, partial [Halieaceae bacterium]